MVVLIESSTSARHLAPLVVGLDSPSSSVVPSHETVHRTDNPSNGSHRQPTEGGTPAIGNQPDNPSDRSDEHLLHRSLAHWPRGRVDFKSPAEQSVNARRTRAIDLLFGAVGENSALSLQLFNPDKLERECVCVQFSPQIIGQSVLSIWHNGIYRFSALPPALQGSSNYDRGTTINFSYASVLELNAVSL